MTETESMVVRVAKAMIAAIDDKEAFVRENDGICDVTVDGHVDFKALARAAIEEFRRLPDHIWSALEQADAEAEWMDSAKAVRHLHDILIDKALEA